jgi:hypothetical protein
VQEPPGSSERLSKIEMDVNKHQESVGYLADEGVKVPWNNTGWSE